MKDFFQTHKVLLAPMAGVSDEAFRVLCLEQGADLTYTEMVSAKGLSYANEKTKNLLHLAPEESHIAVQIFGHEPDTMAHQAVWVEKTLGDKLAYIDINMGCPARKITRKGDGAALMADPDLAAQITEATSSAVKTPVTVKFRRGFSFGEETAVSFAQVLEQAGAAALTVHGRYAEQFYQGHANWDVIARVKQAVQIPVIGNGDIKSAEDALAMKEQTGCDTLMIARGAQGNPWIFAQIQAALAGRQIPLDPSITERIAMARRHSELLSKREGHNIVRMRKHAMWYFTGIPGVAAARRAINECVSLEDFNRVFDELLAY